MMTLAVIVSVMPGMPDATVLREVDIATVKRKVFTQLSARFPSSVGGAGSETS